MKHWLKLKNRIVFRHFPRFESILKWKYFGLFVASLWRRFVPRKIRTGVRPSSTSGLEPSGKRQRATASARAGHPSPGFPWLALVVFLSRTKARSARQGSGFTSSSSRSSNLPVSNLKVCQIIKLQFSSLKTTRRGHSSSRCRDYLALILLLLHLHLPLGQSNDKSYKPSLIVSNDTNVLLNWKIACSAYDSSVVNYYRTYRLWLEDCPLVPQ